MSLKKRMVATAFAFAVTAVFAVQNGKTGDIAAARVLEVNVRFVRRLPPSVTSTRIRAMRRFCRNVCWRAATSKPSASCP